MSFGKVLGETRWTGRLRKRGFFRRLQMEMETVTSPGPYSYLVSEEWVEVGPAQLAEIQETVVSLRKQLNMARIRETRDTREQGSITTLECRVRPRADMPLTEVEALLVDEMQRQQRYATGGLLTGFGIRPLGEETSEQVRPCQAPPHRNPSDVGSGSLASCTSRFSDSSPPSYDSPSYSSSDSSSSTSD